MVSVGCFGNDFLFVSLFLFVCFSLCLCLDNLILHFWGGHMAKSMALLLPAFHGKSFSVGAF